RDEGGLLGEGLDIPYRLDASDGLMLQGIDGVGFDLVDPKGVSVFWSPVSLMWDSSADVAGGPREERIEFPLPGDRTATMDVTIEDADGGDGVAVVSPDEDMLTSPDTVWPVRVDPSLGTRTPAEWVAIRTGGFTSPLYKWTDTTARQGESMGHCSLSWTSACVTTFTSRLVWEFRDSTGTDGLAAWLQRLAGADIVSASKPAQASGVNAANTGTTASRVSTPLWTATKSKSAAQNALSHFNKHGADFPQLNNSLEYVAEAQSFLRSPTASTLTKVRGSGDIVRYDPVTDVFGVMDRSGAPRTFFRPDPASHGFPTNLDYFNAQ
ncbi:hypothetical protein, partial [Microbacterium sp. C7(2022)]|uniref:hypothetical protein n=1 Tax=Microbacterium sp. C7(2022) TaxID=2992759 RepID=UPI00237B44B0